MVRKYRVGARTWWQIDIHVRLPDGTARRIQQRRIPTREQAEILVAKLQSDAFEGRFFDRKRPSDQTVSKALETYEAISKRDNDSWKSDAARGRTLRRHLGETKCIALTREHVEQFRTARLGEKTRRGLPPAPATLDREVELLVRALNYAVSCGSLAANPVAGIPFLRKPNVREVVVDEADFERLLAAADEPLRTVALVSFDTGLRKGEVLRLRWEQVDLRARCLRLRPQDTKEERGRVVYLTARSCASIKSLPRPLRSPWVFTSPETGSHFRDLRGAFAVCPGFLVKIW
jgi:integrase